MAGFYARSELAQHKAPKALIPQCSLCKLYQDCKSPKIPVSGEGRRKVLVVGEAPGAAEDERNEHWAGTPGQRLRADLERIGVDLDRDCWKTNAIICRTHNHAKPTAKQLAYCLPNLTQTIKNLKPVVVLLLGGTAIDSLIGSLWKGDENGVGGISRWAGWQIPDQKLNAWICPTWHPVYLTRIANQDSFLYQTNHPAYDLWFGRHLKAAFQLKERPWDTIPDYKGEVELVKPREALQLVREFIRRGGFCTFDYETNRLKPDYDNAAIYSVSICWRGRRTIAYPFYGEAKDATVEFLRSDLPKGGWNIKFEKRWSRRILGTTPRRFIFDGMVGAHHQDNRPKTTSVKFQAYVDLGFGAWNTHLDSLLKDAGFPKGSAKAGLNRIDEISETDLLTYNGIDSLVEYHCDIAQMERIGLKYD